MVSFTVNTSQLKETLESLHPVIPKKTHREVLYCFHIKAIAGDRDTIRLTASDLDVYATCEIASDVFIQEAGEFVVPAQTFRDYVKFIDDETVSIVLMEEDEQIKVMTETTELNVGTQEIDEFPDFPELPSLDEEGWINLPLDEMREVLGLVLFSAAEKGHPKFGALSAICIQSEGGKLTFMSTDQMRASLASFSTSVDSDIHILVHPKGLGILPKLFEEDLKVFVQKDKQIIFASETTKLVIRVMHGKFPPIKEFIPSYDNKLCITPCELFKQVKKASLATDQNGTIRFTLSENMMHLSTKTRQQRKVANIKMEVPYKGPETKFAVNCKFLLDVLKAVDQQEDIEISFAMPNQPIHIKQNHYDHVVMPQEIR